MALCSVSRSFSIRLAKRTVKPLGIIKDSEKELKPLLAKDAPTDEEQQRITELQKQIAEAKASIFKPIIGCECYCARNGRHSKLASQTTVAAGT